MADLRTRDADNSVVTFDTAQTTASRRIAKTVLSTSDGAAYSASNPFPVASAGSTGTDRSANAAVVSGTPLLTIAANPTRLYVEVQNQSAVQLQLVRDDGAGNQTTSILLAGVGAGQQGGAWASGTFKGRIRVYGTGGSQVGAYED